jgi:hypothetical protein
MNANARRSASRDTNLRRLVAELQIQPLCRDDITTLFDCSATNARNYINAMGSLVKCIKNRRNLQHVYEITGNQKRIDAFLAKLQQPVEPKAPKPPKPEAPVLAPDPARHIHLLADDAPFRVRVFRTMPVHAELHRVFWAGRVAEVVQCG